MLFCSLPRSREFLRGIFAVIDLTRLSGHSAFGHHTSSMSSESVQPGVPGFGDDVVRCPWPNDALYIDYHDNEWGVPVHDDQQIFEFLILEGAQAGLSWYTILKKRDNFRAAFARFEPV